MTDLILVCRICCDPITECVHRTCLMETNEYATLLELDEHVARLSEAAHIEMTSKQLMEYLGLAGAGGEPIDP